MLDALVIKDVKLRVGSLIKTMRNRENITQEQLAEKLGLSRLTIQNLESGKNPTLDTVLKAFQYFDLLDPFNKYLEMEIDNNNQTSLY